ncbi:MAG: AraC family transcriptional regulator [Chitinivibrionales bacterium]|nr:AraC family transcriptional regulator [Chitinivibrionales bacterium]
MLSDIAHTDNPVHLLSFWRIFPRPWWKNSPANHEYHELMVIFGGTLILRGVKEKRESRHSTGEILLYPKGWRHQEQAEPKSPTDSICFQFYGPDFGSRPLPVHDTAGQIRMMSRFLFDARDEYSRLTNLREAYFLAIYEEFLRLREAGDIPAIVQKVHSFIDNHIEEKISLDRLAGHCNLSKYYMIRQYKKLTGATPGEEIARRRIAYARSLITTTDLPLKAIARKCGLANAQHLSHLFRRAYNSTPAQFRIDNT